MIGGALTSGADFSTFHFFLIMLIPTLGRAQWRRCISCKLITIVADFSKIHRLSIVSFTLVIMKRNNWSVNRYFMKVRTTESDELCINIRKQASLQKWVIAKINAWHDMAWMESHLFRFGKEVIDIAI